MFGTAYIDDAMPLKVQAAQFSSGEAFDASAGPTYRVYEYLTETPILTGTLSVFDDSNTVGYYAGGIAISAANGFEVGKYYHVRVAATVDSVDAAESLGMFVVRAVPVTLAEITTALADVWTEPLSALSGRPDNMGEALTLLLKFFINKNVVQSAAYTLYDDDNTTALLTGTLSSTDTTETKGKMS